ncbi:MAG: hypothetical protein HUJ97_00110 [Bacteroidales bacterium]|nr:hypothetical protein [Bacteroidales bacterium]MCF0221391.1 hypothetical protein [Fibrobacter sp.]
MHYELSVACRKLVSDAAVDVAGGLPVAYENCGFTPPANGGNWLKFDYTEVDTVTWSLQRTCRYYVGMCQVSIFFAPGTGVDRPRQLASQLANAFADGTMLDSGYIYEGGTVHPVVKSQSGWFIPVRFYVRLD